MATLALNESAGGATLALAGRLDAYSVGALWREARAALGAHPGAPVTVDCSGVDYCDGAGVGLLLELLRQPRAAGADVRIEGLAERFRRLLDQFDPKSFAAAAPAAPRVSLVERVGIAGERIWTDLRGLVAFLGEATAALFTPCATRACCAGATSSTSPRRPGSTPCRSSC